MKGSSRLKAGRTIDPDERALLDDWISTSKPFVRSQRTSTSSI